MSGDQVAERVEYLRPGGWAGDPTSCGCPRMVRHFGRTAAAVVLWHAPDCAVTHPGRVLAVPPGHRHAPGAVPCPVCGEVAFSWGPAGRPERRCAGPRGCGHVWTPGTSCEPATAALEAARALAHAPARGARNSRPGPDGRTAARRAPAARLVVLGDRTYAPGGDHARPWAPPARTPRTSTSSSTRGYIVARRPSGIGICHLFRRPGEWSLCGEAVWLQVERVELVNALTWICARCQEAAGGGKGDRAGASTKTACADPDGKDSVKPPADQVAAVRRGMCPSCAGALTDPRRSAGGWRHCRACRRGWAVETVGGQAVVTWQDWPALAPLDGDRATSGGLRA